jgi:hypothetical protein
MFLLIEYNITRCSTSTIYQQKKWGGPNGGGGGGGGEGGAQSFRTHRKGTNQEPIESINIYIYI